MKLRLEIVGNLLLGIVSVVFALTVVEVSLRVSNRFDPALDQADPAAQIFAFSDNEEIVFEHALNARASFSANRGNPAWQISTDANGIRRNGEASGSPAEIRGICIGDSIVFGAGLSDHQTIPAQLSDIVSRRLGRRFECLNFGVSNYTTAQEAAYFRHKRGLSYNPKIVVLGLYTNDFRTRPGSISVLGGKTELLSPDAPVGLVGALSRFRLAAMLGSAISTIRDRLREHGLYPRANEKPLRHGQIAAVNRALDQLRADLEADDVPLLIVLFPRDWQLSAPDQIAASPRQQWVKRYCERNQIVCLDLLDHYFGLPVDSYFRKGDDSHPHARAAKVIAELIAADVIRILGSPIPPPHD
jgi:lysophospholipase L1-like esterase